MSSISFSTLAVLALAASATAIDVVMTTPATAATAGGANTIIWTYDPKANANVPAGTTGTIVLMKANGDFKNMVPIGTLASGVDPTALSAGVKFPAGLVNAGDYAYQWQWDGQPATTYKYTGVFGVTGGAATSATTGTSSSTATDSSSATSATSTTSGSASATTTKTITVTPTAMPTQTAVPVASLPSGNGASVADARFVVAAVAGGLLAVL
ncbi:hypothetical protein BC828DRAFT_409631 [Blastocladiella britannica]|nr:hypothetical protein BC828DRAFT_409631 [Blastocladiella britannica]